MNSPDVECLVYQSADALAESVAHRLTVRIAELQRASEYIPQLALTGGGIATEIYRRLAGDGPHSSVAWSQLELWWGDERFVPPDSPDRNDRAALNELRALQLSRKLIHPMPADDGSRGLERAARNYAAQLGDLAFDVCLLGLGPDGHIASMFPGHPSASADANVIAVRNSPKPPPERISLTHRIINRSAEVWFIVSGAQKATAVSKTVSGTGQPPVPAARARGTDRTVLWLDTAAAAELPADILQHGLI
jgi:6-phosphogluconolactonase